MGIAMRDRRDAYDILGVPPHADKSTIERAYRKLARRYHPDLNSSPGATARMQDINWARDTLVDSRSRLFHDRDRRQRASRTRTYSPYTSTTYTGSQQRTSHTYTSPHERAQHRQYTARTRTRTRPAPKAQHDTSWGAFGGVIAVVLMLLGGVLGGGDSSSDSSPRFSHDTINATIAAIVGDYDVSSSGASGGTYSHAVWAEDMIWNRIDSPAERAHYQQVIDDVTKVVDVRVGGYIGRYKPSGAARYYCPPDPDHDGPPSYSDECTVFYSQAGDMGVFDG